MDLKQYDGKCVRVTDISGGVYEGICVYNSAEYDEHEFGVCEEGLDLISFLFCKSDIKKVESLEENNGPYGRFSGPFGKLEETAAEEGFYSVREMLFCEENEHVIRMLRCLDKYLKADEGPLASHFEDMLNTLCELIKYSNDSSVRGEAERLINKLNAERNADQKQAP